MKVFTHEHKEVVREIIKRLIESKNNLYESKRTN